MIRDRKPALATTLFTLLFIGVCAVLISACASPFYNHRVASVDNAHWQKECGACHFAYQPALLPAASWDKLLTAQALRDHFGEAADLDAATLEELRAYALAAASSKYADNADAPLRVTDADFIKRIHRHIPKKMVAGNPAVRSLVNCDVCHTKANAGIYAAKTVLIPNYRDYWINPALMPQF